jgi:Kdo2-lipid IVA lauroyltransferase/acyltransferase
MKKIYFYLLYGSTYIITLLPLKGLYIISDFARFFTYHIVRYRRKTVAYNLKKSFPEKSPKELKKIEKVFYKHFCDLFIEMIYLLHASKENAIKMCKFNNIELLQKYYSQGKSVIIVTGHYSNWEGLNLFANYLKHIVIGIYKPIANKEIETFMNKYRERYGAVAIPMHDTFRTVMSYHQQKKLFFLGLISDQTPAFPEIRYWTTFLNQDTPVFLGVEKIAIKTNQPVFFCNMRRIARGRYEVDIELLCENPKETKPYEITEMHVRALERLIHEAPEYWLWTHRRWKYRRENGTIIRHKY